MRDCAKLIARDDRNLLQVIASIDKGGVQASLIVDSENRLAGVVTDGDIRRAILKGCPLLSCVKDILKKEFYYCDSETSEIEAFNLLRSRGLKILPVLDEEKRPVGFYYIDDLIQPKASSPVVIMAGGFGSRLKPLTNSCPKPMLKIGETPMLQLIIEHFASQGFSNFYLSVFYKGEQIKDYFQDGSNFGVNIDYLEETEPLGTAGALSLLPELDESFLVTNGDVLTKVNAVQMISFHNALNVSLTVGVKEYSQQVPFGVVAVEDGMISAVEEKPVTRHLVNAGIYAFHPRVLKGLKKNTAIDMPDMINSLLQTKEPVSAFPIHEYWSDVGRHKDYELAQKEFIR